eukprot:556996-Amphidinium_carterae.1
MACVRACACCCAATCASCQDTCSNILVIFDFFRPLLILRVRSEHIKESDRACDAQMDTMIFVFQRTSVLAAEFTHNPFKRSWRTYLKCCPLVLSNASSCKCEMNPIICLFALHFHGLTWILQKTYTLDAESITKLIPQHFATPNVWQWQRAQPTPELKSVSETDLKSKTNSPEFQSVKGNGKIMDSENLSLIHI